jgi:hypothetical protein
MLLSEIITNVWSRLYVIFLTYFLPIAITSRTAPRSPAYFREKGGKGFIPIDFSGSMLFWVVVIAVLVMLFVGLISSTPRGISGTKDNIVDVLIDLLAG